MFNPDTRDLSKCWGDLSKFLFDKVRESDVDFSKSINISQILRYTTVANKISELSAESNEPIKVLDVGCSSGTFYGFLSNNFDRNGKKNFTYKGIEVYKKMIQRAEKEYGAKDNFSIDYFDGNLTPISTFGEFDVVIMQQFIEHISYTCALQQLDEAYKVLPPGGLLVLSSPNPDKANGKDFVYPDHHEYEFTLDEISNLLKERGFVVSDTFGWIGMGDLHHSKLTQDQAQVFDSLSKISQSFAEAITAHLNPNFSSYYLLFAVKQ